jgi:uncharacterized Zn finger protein
MWWSGDFFPRSKPREAEGGIRAKSKRGGFGESWWAKRWIAVLESFDLGGRLQRGRSYARGGQVLSIDVTPGKVAAKVQGSRPKPYAVTVELTPLTEKEWAKVTAALSGQAVYAAKLLAGEMPAELEQVAKEAGASLFPMKANDLRTDCSCPDWSNPCKHVAAVYYLLAEEFDRDPFLLFRLRGLDRAALVTRLNRAAPVKSPPAAKPPAEAREPLPTDPAAFWRVGELPPDLFADPTPPLVAAGVVRQLGPIPFWRADVPLVEALEPFYRVSARRGLAAYAGDEYRDG